MPEFDPRHLTEAQQELTRTLAERDRLASSLAARHAQIARLDAEISRASTTGDAQTLAGLRAERDQLAAVRRDELKQIARFDDQLRGVVERLAPLVDTCDADPGLPLLLLPVRLETRYTPDGAALRVRVYPDDISIDQLDTGLNDAEVAAWQEYWTAVWRGTDAQADAAWQRLVGQVGPRRAPWLAAGLTPTNLADRAQAQRPIFPEAGPRTHRAALARLLPDRFVAVAFQGTDRRIATGRPIAPEINVGLIADDGSSFVEVNGVKVMQGAEWVVDFNTAVNVGMALTVPLAQPGKNVDRLVVFGIRRTLDAARTIAELERLLVAHECTRGLAFVPQGTPTNNTESERAGFRARTDPARPPRDVAAPAEGTNAQVLAAALGVRASAVGRLDGAHLREQSKARAANTAFWGSSWGTFLDKINQVKPSGATLDDVTIENARVFHRDFVRGRGPLPALRVGNQPYGLLPVSVLDPAHWQLSRRDAFEGHLHGLLNRARGKWRQAVRGVPRVGVGKIDETLRDILGSAPVSTALRVRSVLSDEAATVGATVSKADPASLAVEHLIEELILEEVILDASLLRRIGSLASKSRPLGMPMVHDGDVAFMEALLARAALPKITSAWQALLQLAWHRADRDVAETAPAGRFGDIVRSATLLEAPLRERVVATASSADRLGSRALHAEADRVETAIAATTALPTLAEYQPLAATRRGFGELALQITAEAAKAPLAAFAAWAHMRALARRAELREALAQLKDTTVAERRILLAETIDCASHRLDAWCTGLVERRRQQRRAVQATGLTVGAYGWVEDIERTGDRQGDGGYVHAPSLAHAATAGILRSAYLAHNGPGADGAFAIDLSSARVRTALHLIDGIRQGQPLGVLLGYQVERAIHEARLDRLILSLRTIAPLIQGKLTDRGQNSSLSAIEALAASNVTDGIDLIEKYQGKVANWGPGRIRDRLSTKPQNNPYLKDETWPALTDAEWSVVSRIIEEAGEACDAVGDLLMAESVHQLVMGNVTRAAAALDAAGPGEAPPPQPAVIDTPVEGVPFVHRLLVIAGTGQPWNLARPRAAAEPRLEAWAGARLGDPSTIRVTSGEDGSLRTLADTGLCALDVLYDAGNPLLLEQRVRSRLALSENIPLARLPGEGWPAGTRAFGEIVELASALRALLANARPAAPGDLARHSDLPTRQPSIGDLAASVQRATLAQGGIRSAATALDARLADSPLNEVELWAAVESTAAYGVVTPVVKGEQLTALATAARAEASRRADDAEAHLKNARDALALPDSAASRATARDAVIAAGRVLFGDGFWIVPELEAPGEPDLWKAAHSPGALTVRAGDIRRFIADFAAVRAPVKRVSDALLLTDALGHGAALRVAQLAAAGASGTDRWIGGPLDPAVPTPQEPVTNIVVDAPADYNPSGATVALVIDQWTDVIPLRERRGSDTNAPIDERATSGICFNAMAPSARAPNTLLLAIAPGSQRWNTELLLQTLVETLDLAKIRLVNLERTNGPARVLPALYAQSWSLQGEPVLDFRFPTGANYAPGAVAAYVKE